MSIRVLFNPINRELMAEKGDNLLDRMHEEGVRIEALCGGKGLCGKCKVILEEGKVRKSSTTPDKFLSHDELDQGYHLVCMVELVEDCVFTIPTESRIDDPKILLSSRLDLPELNPASRKYLAEPTRQPRSSLLLQRRGVRLKEYDGPPPRINDDVHEKLDRLREEGEVTVTVSRTSGFPEIIDAEPGDTRGANYGLAIDIGTTTVVALLVDLTTGDILGTASGMNRQIDRKSVV